jgi:uncharacterized protein
MQLDAAMEIRMKRLWRWAWVAVCLLPVLALAAITPIPELHDPVVDTIGVLDASQAAQLRAQALDLQARRGAQLQILVVDSTGEDGIEAYALRVFDQWKIGRQGVDDGVLLVLAMGDRRVRIQTGYGLEGAIPDAYAQRIIDQAIVPRLREGEPGQGLIDGSALLVRLVDGEALPPPSDDAGVTRLPQDWRRGDSIVALSLLAGFLLGVWPRRPPTDAKAPARRWWTRPLLMLGVVTAGALACALLTPGATPALAIAMGFLVPVAALLGWLGRGNQASRWALGALLVAVIAGDIAWLWSGRPLPSLALHIASTVVLAFVGMLITFLVLALRSSWRVGRIGFFARLVFLSMLTAGFVWLVQRTFAKVGTDAGTVMLVAGTFVLYFAWTLVMALHQRPQKGGKGRRRGGGSRRNEERSSSSSASSSSSSSWSGGGGRSGGGGASGSW